MKTLADKISDKNLNHSNLLKVDYTTEKGLMLKWDLKRNLSQQFYRHILVFDTKEQFQEAFQFAKLYCQRLKPGDFFTVAYFNQEKYVSFTNWKEKGPSTRIRMDDSYIGNLSSHEAEFLLREILRETQMFDEMSVISFFCPEKTKEEVAEKQFGNLNEWIMKMGTNQQKVIINLFGSFQNLISSTTQVNTYDLDDGSFEEVLDFLRLHLSQVAMNNINLSIQCSNGNLSSQKDSAWKNSEFNKIQRKMKAVSSEYEEDVLYFLNEDSSNVKYELEITLEFQNLEQKRFKASKKVIIETINEKVYYRTIGNRESPPSFFGHSKRFECKENPYRSQNYIWFKKKTSIDNGIYMKV